MESADDLVQFIFRNEYTIVFGNLGRYPQQLYNALEKVPQLQIAIQSPFIIYPFSSDNRIRVVNPNQPLKQCDLLVVIEPAPQHKVVKPPNASRIVVFTSHLNFKTCPSTIWTHITYIYASNLQLLARDTKHLLSIQDGSIQTRDVNQVKLDTVHNLILRGRTNKPVTQPETYILIDLVNDSSAFEMFLRFWESFDYMLANVKSIKGWAICFPQKNGRRSFEQFAQNCLDTLFCRKMEYGNVKTLSHLLALVPFYRSGCIDRNFDIPTSLFGDVRYVSVKSPQEACQAATKYDLEHWVGPLYRIKE